MPIQFLCTNHFNWVPKICRQNRYQITSPPNLCQLEINNQTLFASLSTLVSHHFHPFNFYNSITNVFPQSRSRCNNIPNELPQSGSNLRELPYQNHIIEQRGGGSHSRHIRRRKRELSSVVVAVIVGDSR